MLSGNPFAAVAVLVAMFGSDVHGVRPARIAHSADVVRVDTDVTVVSGELTRPIFGRGLFRIGPLWLQVASDAPFHDWLLRARGYRTAVTLTTNAGRYADATNTKILSGKPLHETVPSVSPVVHLMLLQETVTGNIAVTFQTTDAVVAGRLESYMADPVAGSRVSVVIHLE